MSEPPAVAGGQNRLLQVVGARPLPQAVLTKLLSVHPRS